MKIAIIGATGNVGQRIVTEALNRGHQVTGISRNPGADERDNLELVKGDMNDSRAMAELLRGHDVVVSSVQFQGTDPNKLIEAVRQSGVKRYLVVGGASSLEFKPGVLVLDSGHVPDFALDEARSGVRFLEVLRGVTDLDWTFFSPAALFIPGERTGKFRLGKDAVIAGEDGKSWISFEDYAIAMLDEIEHPQHVKTRFTIGY